MIPREFVDEVLGRVDIVEVIAKRVALRKAGRDHKACCPFHDEKTPSFTVSSTKQFYYCFGCHAHGNAIGFLMNYDRLLFVDAVEVLAGMVGMPVPKSPTDKRPDSEPLYKLLAAVNQSYRQNLAQSKQAQVYLQERGLSPDVCQRFELGFVADQWDYLLQRFGKTKNDQALLLRAGLLTQKNQGRPYDRFRGRIMFPIKDRRGRVIAFGGRVIGQGEPKYLNSPETPLFHKSRHLYGLYEAQQAIQQSNRAVIVEGYLDVISLAEHGIDNAVAALGTASNPGHIQQVLKITQDIIFCFDGDLAGRKAAWAALENALPIMRDGIQIRFMFLPKGEDPDSFVRRHGKAVFEKEMDEALPANDFFFQRLQRQRDFRTPAGKARLGRKACKLLARLPNGIFKSLMLKQLAVMLGIEPAQLGSLMDQRANVPKQPVSDSQSVVLANLPAAIKSVLSLSLQHPDLLYKTLHKQDLAALCLPEAMPGALLVNQLITFVAQQPELTTAQCLEHWRDSPYEAFMAGLAMTQQLLSETQLQEEFKGAFAQLQRLARDHTIEQYFTKANHDQLTVAEKRQLQQLLTQRANTELE